MSWAYLVLAGLFEVGFASSFKLTQGFTKLWPTLIFAACILLSFLFLERAIRDIPIGTAYAVWTGIGAVGTAVYGIAVLGEAADALRLTSIVLIVAGIAGLKMTAS